MEGEGERDGEVERRRGRKVKEGEKWRRVSEVAGERWRGREVEGERGREGVQGRTRQQ